jgi:hypothetical protein
VQEDLTTSQEEVRRSEWVDLPEGKETTQDAEAIHEAPEEETMDYDSDNLDIQDGDTEQFNTDESDKKLASTDDLVRHMVILVPFRGCLKRL